MATPRKADETAEAAEVTAPAADAKPADAKPAEAAPAPSKAAAKTEEPSGTGYLNVSGGPLRYDTVGHQVANGQWITVTSLDEIGRRARQRGFLLPRSAL